MAAMGFVTLRFWNHEVLAQTEAVLEKIWQVTGTLTPALSRQRERE
jgi:very-short-patch-repair endonuclease